MGKTVQGLKDCSSVAACPGGVWKTWIAALSRCLPAREPRLFEQRHFRRRERLRPDYHTVARSLLQRVDFSSMFDVGCANGFLLDEFKRAGKQVRGIDLSPDMKGLLPPNLREQVQVGDFARAKGRWDLVCCVEMAEHIPPPRSHELVNKLISLARRYIYFTAAPPGQLGHGHINCRPHRDWLNWFGEAGWTTDPALTAALRQDLITLRKAAWLRRNSFILVPRQQVVEPGASIPTRRPAIAASAR